LLPKYAGKCILQFLGFSVQKVLSLLLPGMVVPGVVVEFAKEFSGE
jgi:hypothetical protein